MREALLGLTRALEGALFGQPAAVEALVATAVAGGHALFEGLPGLGKTLLAQAFARASGLTFSRVQFTPDLLPADITGTEVLREGRFVFEPGPIFAQVVLADEINRAPPKTQSALLEAMQEGFVTAGGERHPLPEPFLVLATQNPVELEGTYPLPEAQLDRFAARIPLAPPPREVWRRILEEDPVLPEPVLDARALLAARAEAAGRRIASPGLEAMVNLALLSHEDPRLRFGLSPRATKSWRDLARALAYLRGRPHVEWNDLRDAARLALPHRLFLTEEAAFEGTRPEAVLEDLLEKAMPRV